MPLSIGIVGLPNVGKSTLFQAITKKKVDTSNYPFCTIDPNLGCVEVPDERLDKLAEALKPKKKIYSLIEFVDIAGLVKGAHQGEGLGNQFLSHIREVDVIVFVLRVFFNEKIINTRNELNAVKEKEILDLEMALKDISVLEKRIKALKQEPKERQVLEKLKSLLEKGKILAEEKLTEKEKGFAKSYQLLTLKPRIYLLNGKENEVSSQGFFEKSKFPFIVMDVLTELESSSFSREERKVLDLAEPKIDDLIKKSFDLLDLITFFTVKSDENRAWNVKKGSTAPQAGGIVHSDFETHFIKAEVASWKDLVEHKEWAKIREKGLLRTEGKEYVVQDGDVLQIKTAL